MKAGKNRLVRESLWIVILVYATIGVFGILPFNLHVFDPASEAVQDVDLTDIYFSKVQTPDATDSSIIVVDIGQHNRAEIAQALDSISKYNPKVVGIDIYFKDTQEARGDSALKLAIDRLSDRVVLAAKFDESGNEEGPADFIKSAPFLGDHPTGYINFVGEDLTSGTVRYFRPVQGNYYHFAVEVVKKSNPEVVKRFLARGNKTEVVEYSFRSNKLTTISLDNVLAGNSDLSIIENKIVLVGLGGDVKEKFTLEDSHFTPLNDQLAGRSQPDMYGIYIHANIISMITRGNEISRIGAFWNFLFASIVGLLHISVYSYFFVNRHAWFHVTAKITQLITSVVLMALSILLLSFNIKWEPGLTMAVILLSVDVMYFYEGFRTFLFRRFKISSYFVHLTH